MHTVRLAGGKEVSMRRWADALAATEFNAGPMPWPQPNSTLGRCPGRNRIQRWADALAATEFNAAPMPWPQPNSTLGRCPGRNRIQRHPRRAAAGQSDPVTQFGQVTLCDSPKTLLFPNGALQKTWKLSTRAFLTCSWL